MFPDTFLTLAHTHPFNGPFSGTTRVSQYQKGKTNLHFTEARDGEWQWHQLGRMQVCTLLQTDNHASTPPLSFLQAGCPSCRPTSSVKALKALYIFTYLCNCDCVRFRWLSAKSRRVLSVCLTVTWSFTVANVTNPQLEDGDCTYYETSCHRRLICGKSRLTVVISAVEHLSFLLTVRSRHCTFGTVQSHLSRRNSVC